MSTETPRSTTSLESVNVGIFTTSSLFAVADARGLFTARGLAVTVQEVGGSRAQMEGLGNGTFDIVHTSPDNIMKARLDDGLDVFVFTVLDTGLPQVFVGSPTTTSWDEPPHVVGVDDPTSGFAFVVYEILRARGVDLSSCEFRSVGTSRQRLDALTDGTIDAGLLSAAMTSAIDARGLHVLASAGEEVPWYPGVAAASIRRVADERPQVLAGYAAALAEALRWSSDPTNQDEFADIVAARSAVSVDEARGVIAREQSARTAVLPTVEQAIESLDNVAGLRRAATGQAPADYFEPRWMQELE